MPRSHQEKSSLTPECDFVSDHPVCGAEVGCAEIFLMPQPPLLTRRGLRLRPFCLCVLVVPKL